MGLFWQKARCFFPSTGHGIIRLFSFTILLVCWIASPAFAFATRNQEWQIDYNSSFAGIVKIKFFDKAMYMRLDKMGLIIIAQAPKWESRVFNEMNKKFMVMNKEQWKNRFAASAKRKKILSPEVLQTVYSHKTEKIEGVTAEKMLLLRRNNNGHLETAMEVWITKGIEMPEQCKSYMHLMLQIPQDFHGTPLRVLHRHTSTGAMVQDLEAYKIAKIKVNPSDFKPPAGYREVKNEVSLMLDDENNSGVGGLMGPER